MTESMQRLDCGRKTAAG